MRVLMGGTGIVKVPPEVGGAIESHVYGLANAMAEQGHEVHVATDARPNAQFHPNVTVVPVRSPLDRFPVRYPMWIGSHLIGGYRVHQAILRDTKSNEWKPDVIHLHEEVSVMLSSLHRKDSALAYTPHNPFPFMGEVRNRTEALTRRAVTSMLTTYVLPKCDPVICLTRQFRDWLLHHLNLPENKAAYVPHPIDTEFFSPNQAQLQEFLEEKNVSSRYFLFVGRLDKRKGVDLLARAIRTLDHETQCVMVGTGPLHSTVHTIAQKEIRNGRLRMLGSVCSADLGKLYAGALFLVLPSFAELSPLVVLEAMSSGLPCVVTDLPVLTDAIREGRTGLRIPRGNVLALQQALRLLSEDTTLCRNLGQNARKYIIQNHAYDVVARQLAKSYTLAG